MKTLHLAAAVVFGLAATVPAMAQSTMSYPAQTGRPSVVGSAPASQPTGGSPGYQANTYVRRPSPRTPTDVGNMAFPDPSQTPAGNLTPVQVGR